MSDAPEMLYARLYVFEGQNFVSEKDYRAVLEQRRELQEINRELVYTHNTHVIMHARAEDRITELEQLAEGFRLERNIMQEMAMKAREAGRREGLRWRDALIEIRDRDYDCSCDHSDDNCCCVVGNYCAFCIASVALIDSPKAEVEEPDGK